MTQEEIDALPWNQKDRKCPKCGCEKCDVHDALSGERLTAYEIYCNTLSNPV